MAAPKKTAKRGAGFATTLVALIVLGLPLALAPMAVRGLAASAWVDHYGNTESLRRPRRAAARELVARVDAELWNLSPLPRASAAAIRALENGQRTENVDKDRESALVIYQGVRAACERARSRPMGGSGLAVVEARAAALEDAARRAGAK